MYCVFASLGDKKQALKHLQLLLESKSEFLNEFMMERLRFSSSLYMTLIWLRVFRWVLHFPDTVKRKMNPQLEGFRDFFEDPTADKYLECIFDEISKTSSQPGPSKSNVKRRLADISDSDESDDEAALPSTPSRFLPSSDGEEEQTKHKNKKIKVRRTPIVRKRPTFVESDEELPKEKKKKSKKK